MDGVYVLFEGMWGFMRPFPQSLPPGSAKASYNWAPCGLVSHPREVNGQVPWCDRALHTVDEGGDRVSPGAGYHRGSYRSLRGQRPHGGVGRSQRGGSSDHHSRIELRRGGHYRGHEAWCQRGVVSGPPPFPPLSRETVRCAVGGYGELFVVSPFHRGDDHPGGSHGFHRF